MQVTPKSKKLGSVGGRGGSATSGGYNQGASIAAQHGIRHVGSHKDLRGGTAPASTGYAQGNSIAATTK